MKAMFWIWMIGALFTDGLLDPQNKGGIGEGMYRLLLWPYELGQYVHNQIEGEAGNGL